MYFWFHSNFHASSGLVQNWHTVNFGFSKPKNSIVFICEKCFWNKNLSGIQLKFVLWIQFIFCSICGFRWKLVIYKFLDFKSKWISLISKWREFCNKFWVPIQVIFILFYIRLKFGEFNFGLCKNWDQSGGNAEILTEIYLANNIWDNTNHHHKLKSVFEHKSVFSESFSGSPHVFLGLKLFKIGERISGQ